MLVISKSDDTLKFLRLFWKRLFVLYQVQTTTWMTIQRTLKHFERNWNLFWTSIRKEKKKLLTAGEPCTRVVDL